MNLKWAPPPLTKAPTPKGKWSVLRHYRTQWRVISSHSSMQSAFTRDLMKSLTSRRQGFWKYMQSVMPSLGRSIYSNNSLIDFFYLFLFCIFILFAVFGLIIFYFLLNIDPKKIFLFKSCGEFEYELRKVLLLGELTSECACCNEL